MSIYVDNYDQAVEILNSYTQLPLALRLPACIMWMNEIHGHRKLEKGRVRSMVERYLWAEARKEANMGEVSPQDVPTSPSRQVRHDQEVEWLKEQLVFDGKRGKWAFVVEREWYYSPRKIAEVLSDLGKPWYTDWHVKQAMQRMN
jgi:hypothetical protein